MSPPRKAAKMKFECPTCGGSMILCEKCGEKVARKCGRQRLCKSCSKKVHAAKRRKSARERYHKKKLKALIGKDL